MDKNNLNLTYDVKTWIQGSDIHIESGFSNDIDNRCREILKTKERAVMDRLIELGWTPPKS